MPGSFRSKWYCFRGAIDGRRAIRRPIQSAVRMLGNRVAAIHDALVREHDRHGIQLSIASVSQQNQGRRRLISPPSRERSLILRQIYWRSQGNFTTRGSFLQPNAGLTLPVSFL